MIVCINCSKETKAQMDDLLSKHNYTDYSELVSIAVGNLYVMESEFRQKGTLDLNGNQTLPVPKSSSPAESTRPIGGDKAVSPLIRPCCKSPGASHADVAPTAVRIPGLFLADGLKGLSCSIGEPLRENKVADTFTIDRWVFGQYNKLLPAKANCRALIRLAHDQPNGIPLEKAAPQIAEAAALLGDYLADHDSRHQTGRDDALSTAFPRSGPGAEKSRIRYANQFVGIVNSQGILSGLLAEYRLASLVQGEGGGVLPTQAAVDFACLANPILDTCQSVPTQKFSPEETAFLLKHINSRVPAEAFAFRTLLHAIADGANTPDTLDEALRSLVPDDANRPLSQSFLNSQRSSALSRMADLGLVTRMRMGVKVAYIVTDQGQVSIHSH